MYIEPYPLTLIGPFRKNLLRTFAKNGMAGAEAVYCHVCVKPRYNSKPQQLGTHFCLLCLDDNLPGTVDSWRRNCPNVVVHFSTNFVNTVLQVLEYHHYLYSCNC